MDRFSREQFLESWARWRDSREAEWRRHRHAREGFDANPLACALETQMADLGLAERMLEDQLVAAWEEIVGAANAANSRPVQLKRMELIIAVAQPALMYDLDRFHKSEILRRLQERFGSSKIRAVRFRVGN